MESKETNLKIPGVRRMLTICEPSSSDTYILVDQNEYPEESETLTVENFSELVYEVADRLGHSRQKYKAGVTVINNVPGRGQDMAWEKITKHVKGLDEDGLFGWLQGVFLYGESMLPEGSGNE